MRGEQHIHSAAILRIGGARHVVLNAWDTLLKVS